MSCKHFEKMIISLKEDSLTSEETVKLEKHLSFCAGCLSFKEGLEKIRFNISKTPESRLSDRLISDTKNICFAKLSSLGEKRSIKLPKYVWAILIVLTIIGVIWMMPVLMDLEDQQLLFFKDMSVIFFIVQNIIMLALSPLLLRKYPKILRVT